MRTLLILAAFAVTLTLITGCGGEDREVVKDASGVELPEWFDNPGMDGNIGATGIAAKSLGGNREQTNAAMQDARNNLAQTISVKVQAAYTRFFSEGGEKSWAEDGSIDNTSLAQELTENVSRQITNQVIEGSGRKKSWFHPNGDLCSPV